MARFDYDVVGHRVWVRRECRCSSRRREGYRAGVMESGKRWNDEDIPKTNWNLTHFLWQPEMEMYCIQRMEYLGDVLVLSGAGVGGGSHVHGKHVVSAAEAVLRRPGMGRYHRLG